MKNGKELEHAKSETKESNKQHTIATVSATDGDGHIIELVYDAESRKTMLAVGNARGWKIRSRHRLSNGDLLVPYAASNNLIRHHVILFPREPEHFKTQTELIQDIRSYINKYLDVSETFLDIAAYYILFSWIYDGFNELPYLRTRGTFGSGKTRFLLIIGSVCYKPIFASGASTISPLFHMLDSFRGTLLIDEADFLFSDEKSEIVKILNNGNVRGFPVLRSEKTPSNEFNPRAFNVFGPKIVATRGTYEDAALESRFITEEMHSATLRSDIPINLPAQYEDEALRLRNKLLTFRFRNFTKNRVLNVSVDRNIEPRLAQIFTPLLSVIEEQDVRVSVMNLIRNVDAELRAERGTSAEVRILEIISDMHHDGRSTAIALADVCREFISRFGDDYPVRITPRWIGSVMRGKLRLQSQRRRGVYVVPPNELVKLPRLYRHFGIVGAKSAPDTLNAKE